MRKIIASFGVGFILALALAGVVAAAVVVATDRPRALTRAEAAPLLVEVYVAATGDVPPNVECPFTDIGNVPRREREAICQLWGLGVVVGTERDVLYSPELPFGRWAEFYLRNLAEAIVRDR